MSKIFNEFKIFDTFPKRFKQNISIFHAFESDFAICVTDYDEVYSFGEKYFKSHLGYEDKNVEDNYILISELCDRNIDKFYYFENCLFATSFDQEVFGSGNNEFGHLARGYHSEEHLKPQLIKSLSGKDIIDMTFGKDYCLALSIVGLVYGWGKNLNMCRIDCQKPGIEQRVKHIHTYDYKSVLVYFDGIVYDLEESKDEDTIDLNASISELNDIHKIYLSHKEKKIILRNNGIIDVISLKGWKRFEVCPENLLDTLYYSKQLFLPIENGIQIIDIFHGSSAKYKNISYFEHLIEYQLTFTTILLSEENDVYFNDFELTKLVFQQQILAYTTNKIDFDLEQYLIKTFNTDYSINLKRFRNFNSLPEILESKVKYYYQIGKCSLTKYSAIFVMNDNKVYGIGDNQDGILGLGHKERITEFTLIEELCDQNIEEFFEGNDFMFGRNNKNLIFSWGVNEHGQMARGYESKYNEYLKPIMIDFFENKNIIQISCGYGQCLGLSEDGVIYGWGLNIHGQTGSRSDNRLELTPIRVQISDSLDNRIKFIDCSGRTSCAVTVDGRAYLWGQIIKNDTLVPKLIETNVTKMYTDYFNQFSILTTNEIFKYFANGELAFEEKNVKNIYNYHTFRKDDKIYEQIEKCLFVKTSFSNYHEYYWNRFNRIFGTIHINGDGYLMRPEMELNSNENGKLLKKIFVNVYDRNFEDTFEIIKTIGSGSFGMVFQVQNISNNHVFAVKRIRIKG